MGTQGSEQQEEQRYQITSRESLIFFLMWVWHHWTNRHRFAYCL